MFNPGLSNGLGCLRCPRSTTSRRAGQSTWCTAFGTSKSCVAFRVVNGAFFLPLSTPLGSVGSLFRIRNARLSTARNDAFVQAASFRRGRDVYPCHFRFDVMRMFWVRVVCTVRSHTLFRRRLFFSLFFVRSFVRSFVSVVFFFISYDGVGRGVVLRTRCSIDTVWMQNEGCHAWIVSSCFFDGCVVSCSQVVDGGSTPMDLGVGQMERQRFPFLSWDPIDRILPSSSSLASGTLVSFLFLLQQGIACLPLLLPPRLLLVGGIPPFVCLHHLPFLCGPGPSIPVSHTHRDHRRRQGRRTRRETKNQPKRTHEPIAHLRLHPRVRKQKGGTVPTGWNHVGEKAHEPRSSVLRKQTQKTGAEPP